ncbi:MAG: hypothetical protein ACKPKO_20855, partial [Candidatus Fonsibacter sp.]
MSDKNISAYAVVLKYFLLNIILTLAAFPGLSSNGWILPIVSFPIHNDIHSVEVHIRVHVYETILGTRVIYNHWS